MWFVDAISQLLPAALLMLFNMARGCGKLPHWAWFACAAWIIGFTTISLLDSVVWLFVVVVVTITATKPLLHGIDGDKSAIKDAIERNIPIMAIYWRHPLAAIMLAQGLVYYLCGKLPTDRNTRIAEGATGMMLGALIVYG